MRGQITNPAWEDECSNLEGTVPGLHPPNLRGRTKIYDTELERPIELDEAPTDNILNRLLGRVLGKQSKVRRFVWSKRNFESWFNVPKNLCYRNGYRSVTFNDDWGESKSNLISASNQFGQISN